MAKSASSTEVPNRAHFAGPHCALRILGLPLQTKRTGSLNNDYYTGLLTENLHCCPHRVVFFLDLWILIPACLKVNHRSKAQLRFTIDKSDATEGINIICYWGLIQGQ